VAAQDFNLAAMTIRRNHASRHHSAIPRYIERLSKETLNK